MFVTNPPPILPPDQLPPPQVGLSGLPIPNLPSTERVAHNWNDTKVEETALELMREVLKDASSQQSSSCPSAQSSSPSTSSHRPSITPTDSSFSPQPPHSPLGSSTNAPDFPRRFSSDIIRSRPEIDEPTLPTQNTLFSPSDELVTTPTQHGAEHLQRTSDGLDITTSSSDTQSTTQDPKPSITVASTSSASDPSNYGTPSSSSFRDNGNESSDGNSSNGNQKKQHLKKMESTGGEGETELEKQERKKLEKALRGLSREMGGMVPDSDD
ncbi:hypothetical protein BDY24DRAFT_440652 [Mrakia frigida]|uniref:uncharacterized protein n=1 Tax=Mrakia frigida TaxID=29902 RepID=UPI003FCC11DD